MSEDRWDKYFLDICNVVASNSKCHSTKVGAIIVRDRSVLSTGYNGPPRGVMECPERFFYDKTLIELAESMGLQTTILAKQEACPRRVLGIPSGKGLDICVAGHAEQNAIVNAAREGTRTKGATLYTDRSPCGPCLVACINAGIVEVVCHKIVLYDKAGEFLMNHGPIKVREFSL